MKWRLVLHPEIDNDLEEASTWYNLQQDGLGSAFTRAALDVFETLAENPYLNARRVRQRHARMRLVRRFPYKVIYDIREGERIVKVIAIQHCARHDRHWRRRLD